MRCHKQQSRRGTTAVQFAVTAPLLFLLLVGLLVGGLAIFRYQEVAHLAREAARYASVRGGQYAQDTGNAAADEAAVAEYIRGKAVILDPSRLDCTVTWLYSDKMPMRPDPTSDPPGQTVLVNKVAVTVTYEWIAEALITSPVTLSSTSDAAVAY
jgi:Flp pilus assembly protein TadG